MTTTDQDILDKALWRVSETPPVQRLMDEFKRAGGISSASLRKRRNDRIRYCRWDGRATDYKKHRELLGFDPIPYEDAWDGRLYTADGIIEDLGDVLSNAFSRAQFAFKPTGIEDLARAANAKKVFGKYVERDRATLDDEAEMIWQFGLGYGASVWQVYWDRTVALKLTSVTVGEIEQAAAEARMILSNPLTPALSPDGGEGVRPFTPALSQEGEGERWLRLAALPQQIADTEREDEAVDTIQFASREMAAGLFSQAREDYGDGWLKNYELSKTDARKVIRDLRNKGSAKIPAPYLLKNAPCVVAREVGYDYFCPPEMTDPERAAWHIVRDWMTPTDIMEAKASDGWDPEWCERAIMTKGQTTEWGPAVNIEDSFELDDESEVYQHGIADGKSDLVEVLYCYARYTTEQGIPQIWCTVLCPHALNGEDGEEIWAKHYVMGDSDSYGFFQFRWQRKRRNFHENIGIPELVGSDQQLMKRTADQLTDRADMELNPPWMVANRLAMRYKAGPGAQIPRRRQGDIEPAAPPTGSPQLGFELIKETRYRLDNYFGLMTEHVLPAKWQLKLQRRVGRYLSSAQAMFKHYWRLIQQNADAAELERIAGADPEFPTSPEEIAGEFDLSLYFDVKDLDMEFVFKKLDAVAKMAVPLDRAGVLDLAALVRLIVTSIDPTYSQALVRDDSSASRMMFKEVDNEVLRMFAGNEADYVENDPAAGRKLEFLDQIVKSNPRYLQALGAGENSQPDPVFLERLQKYQQNLQQSVKQEQNKQVGRLGVVPDNAELQAG